MQWKERSDAFESAYEKLKAETGSGSSSGAGKLPSAPPASPSLTSKAAAAAAEIAALSSDNERLSEDNARLADEVASLRGVAARLFGMLRDYRAAAVAAVEGSAALGGEPIEGAAALGGEGDAASGGAPLPEFLRGSSGSAWEGSGWDPRPSHAPVLAALAAVRSRMAAAASKLAAPPPEKPATKDEGSAAAAATIAELEASLSERNGLVRSWEEYAAHWEARGREAERMNAEWEASFDELTEQYSRLALEHAEMSKAAGRRSPAAAPAAAPPPPPHPHAGASAVPPAHLPVHVPTPSTSASTSSAPALNDELDGSAI